MKKIALLLATVLLLNSCYSYRPFSSTPEAITIGKKYHFDLKSGDEFIRKIDSIDTNAYYVTRGGVAEKIDFSEVSRLEEGKFSIGRTLGLSGMVAVGTAAVVGMIIFLTNW
jgi:hypothetical protein